MAIYERGVPVNLVQRFYTVDALTGQTVPTNPTGVLFTLENPDGVETTYALGTSPQVVNDGVGVFICTLPLTDIVLPGTYRWRCDGTGAVVASTEGNFDVVESGVLAPETVDSPTIGPCSSWITGSDVATIPGVSVGSDSYLLDTVAYEASMALFEISGRQFSGECQRKVRPARQPCQCWAPDSTGMGPWYWTASSWGVGTWSWQNECGDRLGCEPMSVVRLAGYPVRRIVQVKIDGTVVPALDTNGHPNYRLDRFRDLVRMDDPGPPVSSRVWPSCQNLSLDDSQPGTFSVTYIWGIDPPQLGRDAAAQVAYQLYLSMVGGAAGQAVLPQGVTRLTRQGVEIERGLLANWFNPDQPTGLTAVDLFLRSYWPLRTGRRPAVFSPDVQQYARREGF